MKKGEVAAWVKYCKIGNYGIDETSMDDRHKLVSIKTRESRARCKNTTWQMFGALSPSLSPFLSLFGSDLTPSSPSCLCPRSLSHRVLPFSVLWLFPSDPLLGGSGLRPNGVVEGRRADVWGFGRLFPTSRYLVGRSVSCLTAWVSTVADDCWFFSSLFQIVCVDCPQPWFVRRIGACVRSRFGFSPTGDGGGGLWLVAVWVVVLFGDLRRLWAGQLAVGRRGGGCGGGGGGGLREVVLVLFL